MKRRAYLVSSICVGVVVSLALLAGCDRGKSDGHAAEGAGHAEHAGGKEKHSEPEELTLTSEEAARDGVKVEEIAKRQKVDAITTTAVIRADPDRLAKVAPRIEGRVLTAPAKLGQRVTAGQALATMDSVAVAEAHLALQHAESDLRIAETDYKRAESLNAEQIIPYKEFQKAQNDREKARVAVRSAGERLRLLGGGPSTAGGTFSVNAPFAGTVIEKKATIGTLASPSEPLYTIADLSRVWIQADVPEVALGRVRLGAKATVKVSAYPDDVFTGQVAHIGAGVDKETRAVPVRIEVVNSDSRLKPEMFATATIESSNTAGEVIAIPDAAIVLMQGQPTVFVYEQGAYVLRPVEPGERMDGRTEIKSGLSAGEQVVTAGAYSLKARKQKSQLGHGH